MRYMRASRGLPRAGLFNDDLRLGRPLFGDIGVHGSLNYLVKAVFDVVQLRKAQMRPNFDLLNRGSNIFRGHFRLSLLPTVQLT
jgi:hypothetical protein